MYKWFIFLRSPITNLCCRPILYNGDYAYLSVNANNNLYYKWDVKNIAVGEEYD